MAQTPLNAAPTATFTEFNIKQDTSSVPHFVRLHDSVVEDLEAHRQRPMEAGGVLFGNVDAEESCAITVQDFEAIVCEHRRGERAPAVDCSSQCLEKAIRRIRAAGRKNLMAVGYYRPAQRGEFGLEREDREWIKKHFGQQESLLLVLKPDDGLDLGVFYLGIGGLLAAERSTVEFPVSLQELCGAPAGSAVPVPAGLAALSASPAGSPPVTAPATPRAASSVKLSMAWKAALTAALLLGGGFAFRAFHLASPDGRIGEPAAAAVEQTPVKSMPPAAAPSKPAAKPDAPAPSVTTPPVMAAADSKPVAAPKVVTPSPRDSTVSRAVASAAGQSGTPVAAPVTSTQPAPAPAVTNPAPEGPAAPTVKSSAQPASEPAVTATSNALSTATPTPAPAAALPVIAPRAVYRPAPVIPAALKRRINGEVQIDIQVDVDASGKVARAVSLTKGDALTNQLSGLVLEAARKWQFDAATQSGQKVASQAKLQFRFQQ